MLRPQPPAVLEASVAAGIRSPPVLHPLIHRVLECRRVWRAPGLGGDCSEGLAGGPQPARWWPALCLQSSWLSPPPPQGIWTSQRTETVWLVFLLPLPSLMPGPGLCHGFLYSLPASKHLALAYPPSSWERPQSLKDMRGREREKEREGGKRGAHMHRALQCFVGSVVTHMVNTLNRQ